MEYKYKSFQKVQIVYENYHKDMPATFEGIVIKNWYDANSRHFDVGRGAIAMYLILIVEVESPEILYSPRVDWIKEKYITQLVCKNIEKNKKTLLETEVSRRELL